MQQLIEWVFTKRSVFDACVGAIFCFLLLTRFRSGKKLKNFLFDILRIAGIFIVYYVGCIAGAFIGNFISDEWRAFLQLYVSRILTMILSCLLFRDFRVQTRIVYAALFTTTWILGSAFNFMAAKIFDWLTPVLGGVITFEIPRLLVTLVLVVLLKRFNIDGYEGKSNYSVMFFLVFCIIVCLLQSFTFFSVQDVSTINQFTVYIWIMEMAAYFFYYLFLRENKKYMHSEIENRRLEGELQYFQRMNSYFDEMRFLKHDLKNNFSYINLLYSQKMDEDAKKFFKEVSDAAEGILDFVSTGNIPIDIALNLTITNARKAGIQMEYSCNVPMAMNFENSDLFSLLINLFDNAVEGCDSERDGEKKIIVNLYSNESYFIIYLANTIGARRNGELPSVERSTKEKPSDHGYGHRIIERMVQKYDGDILYSVENGMFIVKAMLSLYSKND